MQNLHKWEMLLLKLFDTIGSSINNGKLKCHFLNAIIDPFSTINLIGAGQKYWKHSNSILAKEMSNKISHGLN
jgi:hypothetical protein